ncbi:MAG TPA: S8 family serine peptidase [Burkholderiaceae bacterium]
MWRRIARGAFAFVWLLLAAATMTAPARAADDPPRQVLVLLEMTTPHFRPDGNYSGGYADAAGRTARRRIAADLARTHGLRLATDWPMPALGLDCYVMDVPPPLQPDEIAARLAREPRVAWAQTMNVFRPLGAGAGPAAAVPTHDDPLYPLQPAAREWHLNELHAAATGQGVRVAVIDGAVQRDHPDLVQQLEANLNFAAGASPDGGELHGTAVAGLIAARADNGIGIVGIAPRAHLLALRACSQPTPADAALCTSLSLALALNAAIDREARVINLSLAGPSDRLVQRLVETAQTRGATVVAAASRSAPQGGFPARLDGVIATLDDTATAVVPNAYVAPGTDVPSTVPGSRWATLSGSSYAAAQLSGLVALLLDARTRSGAAPGPVGADLVRLADGRIDACASLARAALGCVCACAAPPSAIEAVARH